MSEHICMHPELASGLVGSVERMAHSAEKPARMAKDSLQSGPMREAMVEFMMDVRFMGCFCE